jgi:predicted transcriptional regulator of viral defense system
LLKIAIIRNNLSYQQFQNELGPFKVFSTKDILKAFPHFDSKRLVEWQEKGYIKKIINKWYIFAKVPQSEELFYRISNCIYHPSYISLESALSYYGLIPEAVYIHQAISTKRTIAYTTSLGTFNYRTVRPELYFGYKIFRFDEQPILVAEPEKALLDYLYLNAKLNSLEDLEALRLNISELQTMVIWEKLLTYAAVYKSNVLNKRIKLIKKIMLNANIA